MFMVTNCMTTAPVAMLLVPVSMGEKGWENFRITKKMHADYCGL